MHNIPTIHYSADEVIIREGEPSSSVYMIISGKVEISKKAGSKDIILATQGKNTIFGEMSLIDGKRRSASVKAIENTYCHRCDTLALMTMINKLDPELIHALKSLASIIRKNNKILVESQAVDSGVEKFEAEDKSINLAALQVEDEKEPLTITEILSPQIQDKLKEVKPPFLQSLYRILLNMAQK